VGERGRANAEPAKSSDHDNARHAERRMATLGHVHSAVFNGRVDDVVAGLVEVCAMVRYDGPIRQGTQADE
jgi:hypothetical protein